MNRFLLPLLLLLIGCSASEEEASALRPAHHTDDGFRNPYAKAEHRGFFDYLRMRWFGDEEFVDYRGREHLVPVRELDAQQLKARRDAPRVTWLGHATVLLQHAGVTVITDPILSRRASPVSFAGPERYTPLPIEREALPPIDYAVISHNHYDHLDAPTVEWLGDDVTWLVPLGLREWFLDQGIDDERVLEFDWWDSRRLGSLRVQATPSQHWSGRGLFDRYESLWAAWALDIAGFRVWFGGDTGYSEPLFASIGERFPEGFDLGLIPIGAYSPRWFMKTSHVNPEEAVTIHRVIGARRSLAIHWGTFYLTGEPIEEPPRRLAAELERLDLDPESFESWAIGESRLIDQTVDQPVESSKSKVQRE